MNDDSGAICLLGMAIVGLPPMLILLTALVPGYVERARAVVQAQPRRSFALGLVNGLFFGALSLLTGAEWAPVTLIGGLSLVIVLPLFLVLGLLVAAGIAGERIWLQVTSRPGSLLGATVLGTLVLGLTLLVPILGWVLFLGLTLTGLGASIQALFRRPRPESVPETSRPMTQPIE
ncbi:MAG: hypothetical protein SXV54_09540 [Chloroflexota bacterium]|nr:hypothetical protein [Chloroflexota bacterium]